MFSLKMVLLQSYLNIFSLLSVRKFRSTDVSLSSFSSRIIDYYEFILPYVPKYILTHRFIPSIQELYVHDAQLVVIRPWRCWDVNRVCGC